MSQSHFTSSATTNTTVDVQRSVKTHKSMSGLHETRGSEKVLSPKHRKTSESQLLAFNPPPPPPVPALPSFAALSALEVSGTGGVVGSSGVRDVRSESMASTTSSLSHDVAPMVITGNDALMTSAELTTRRESNGVNGRNTSYEESGGSAGYRMTFSSTRRSSSSRLHVSLEQFQKRRIPQSLPAEAIDTPVSTALPATTKPHNNTNTNTSSNRHATPTTLKDVPDYLADSLSPPRVNTPSRLSSSRHTVEVGSPLDDSLHMQDHRIVKEYSRSL